ncbi:MAG: DUF255 domain-containing protein [Planctomycetes bacterium]|nr:DUF255 domain-containing protein [Planctomycetota bacterium]
MKWDPRTFIVLALALAAGPRAQGEDPAPVSPKDVPPKEESPVKATEGGKPKYTNRLAKETSPYLLQHQHNPVDWYAWGEEAFEKARKEDKPVFLSIGYSACHWCHVMERECFEDEEVAKLLNEKFVSIKVDREERPDVDDIYMRYVHLTKQSGGWPMSIVMTPQGAPYFGGTYFPKPAFMQVLNQVAAAWQDRKDKIVAHTQQVVEILNEEANARYKEPERPLTRDTVRTVTKLLERFFDYQNGGLQSQRKFPPHMTMEMLVELVAKDPKNAPARDMLTLTLDKMQLGGIHDHLGGGFHRYATDPIWFLPHFEKMLYDNAQAARYYARASAVLKNEEYARTARGIYEWVLREMRAPEGVFYSAYDADSEGEEGKFYVWDKREIDEVLGEDAKLFETVYRIKPDGNFNEEATGHPTGLNIPHLDEPLADTAIRLKMAEGELRAKLDALRKKLLAVRVKRVWPHLDDKILTSWNALMLGSLAQGSIHLKEPRYREAAVSAAEWLLKNHRTKDGRWLATSRKSDARLDAYLDDHACLANAFMDLFDTTGEARWKDEAAAVVKILNAHFWDEKNGGYFFVSDDHEKLLVRVKNPSDNATPSGNGIAAQALVRLAKATGDKAYADRAGRIFATFHTLLDLAPVQVESLLLGFEWHLDNGAQPDAAVAAKPKDQPKVQRGPVIAELFVGLDKLPVGSKVPIAIRLTLDKGYHIQAHKPAQEGLIGTAFRVTGEAWGALIKEQYPAPVKLPAPELGGDLLVYSASAMMGGLLEVPQNAKPGNQALEVEVEFQACSEKACLAPEKVTLRISVQVVAADLKCNPLYENELRELNLGSK